MEVTQEFIQKHKKWYVYAGMAIVNGDIVHTWEFPL